MKGSYIVRKSDGTYISAYNKALGEKAALSYAITCARYSKANIYENESGIEKIVMTYKEDELTKVV